METLAVGLDVSAYFACSRDSVRLCSSDQLFGGAGYHVAAAADADLNDPGLSGGQRHAAPHQGPAARLRTRQVGATTHTAECGTVNWT